MAQALTHPALRHLLALIAAKGILGHNTVVPMPGAFTVKRLREIMGPEGTVGQLESDLRTLTDLGLLRCYNTGHAGYANSYVEGPDEYSITVKGLMELWGAI